MNLLWLTSNWLKRTMYGFPLFIGLVSIAITVGLLMGVKGVIKGFETHMMKGVTVIIGDWTAESMLNQAHQSRGLAQLQQHPGIRSAYPIYTGSAILLINGSFRVVHIIGINPTMLSLPRFPIPPTHTHDPRVWISQGLQEKLGITCPEWAIIQTPLTQQNQRVQLFQSVPLPPIADWGMIITTTANAVLLTGGLGTWGIQIRASNRQNRLQLQSEIEHDLGPGWVIQNWKDVYPQLSKTLTLLRQVGGVITLLVGGLGSLSLAMVMGGLIQRHQTSIAILRLNGVRPFHISLTILLATAIISGIGCCLGWGIGLFEFWVLRRYLPFECVWGGRDWILVGGYWMGCLLVGMWPAWRSSRIDPGIMIK